MPVWADLARARQDLLRSYRSRARIWSEQTLPVLIQGYRTRTRAALEEVLEAAMRRRGREDLDAFEEELRDQVRRVLLDRRTDILQTLKAEMEGLARSFDADAGPALATRLDSSAGGLPQPEEPRPRIARALRARGSLWQPPSLGQPSESTWELDLKPGFLRLALPEGWARRRAAAQIRAGLPKAILETSRQLEQMALGYWDRCLDSLDQALDLAIQQIRAAWERGAGLEALLEPSKADSSRIGCRVCAEVWHGLYDFFRQLQHQLATGEDAQVRFRTAHGLCPNHLWVLERFSSPRGLCAGLPALVEDIARHLASHGEIGVTEGSGPRVPGLAQAGACLACETLERETQDAVERLARGLGEGKACVQEDQVPDLCLQHLPLLLERVDPARGAELARRLALRLARVAEAMAGFALKSDARRRDLLSDAEREAYREGLEWLAGDRNLLGRFGGGT